MLEQNVWAACGMGTGVNLSFLAHQSLDDVLVFLMVMT